MGKVKYLGLMVCLTIVGMFIPQIVVAQSTGEVRLVDAAGGEVLSYVVSDTEVYVEVLDGDDPSEVVVELSSPVDMIQMVLTRVESGVYRGSVAIEESADGVAGDQALQSPRGSELEVLYTDGSDSFGNQKEIRDQAYYGVTLVSGVYSSDRTWRKSESPYLVTGDVEVNNGAKLTIEPGVEVRFIAPSELASGDDRSSGRDANRSELRIVAQSKLEAVGTVEEPIILRSNNEESSAGDWWGIYAENNPKIRIEHSRVEGSTYGLYLQNVGGSVLDTMYIRHNEFTNIAQQAFRTEYTHWYRHVDLSDNILVGGIYVPEWTDDYNSDNLLEVKISGNDFRGSDVRLSGHPDDRYDDFKVLFKDNKGVGNLSMDYFERVNSDRNTLVGQYYVRFVKDYRSRRDSLERGLNSEEGNGWYITETKRAQVNQTYVKGYNTGMYLDRSTVSIDSSMITGNSGTGIYVNSDFNNLSRTDTLRYSTVTGNGGDGIRVTGYGRMIANYNNLYGNIGYEYKNESDKWEEVDARYNWWGENTTTLMNAGSNPKNLDEIYDVYDNNGLGFVNYSGWLDAKDGEPSGNSGDTGEVRLVDAAGGEVLSYVVSDTEVYVEVLDGDDPSEVVVELSSPVDMIQMVLTRVESGVYRGSVAIEESADGVAGDQALQSPRGSELEVLYTDGSDSFGNQKEIRDQAYYGVTLVSGVYSSDRTWRKSESPYLVTGDVEVNNGAKLTIEPGVEVRFIAPSELASGDDRSSGRDANRSELRIVAQSKLEAVGTVEEPIILRSNNEESSAGDWWGIYAENNPKIRIEHSRVEGSTYGLYLQNVGGSVLDTMYIRHNEFTNIAQQAFRTEYTHWYRHVDLSDNILVGGIYVPEWTDDYNSDNLLEVKISGNDFRGSDVRLSGHPDDRYDDFKVLFKDNKGVGNLSMDYFERVNSDRNTLVGQYYVRFVKDYRSRRDSLERGLNSEEGNGWYITETKRAQVNQTYVKGYNTGMYLDRSTVSIDSSMITGNSGTGIYVNSDFNNLSRTDTLRYSTVTGNGGDGIRVTGYGRMIANYNNLYGNIGYEYKNESDKWEEVDARYNWWGENTTTLMNAGSNPKNLDEIYDVYDNNGLGFVNYSGWLDEMFEIIIVDPKDKVYLSLADIDAFIDDTSYASIELDNLGNRTISGYQFTINYDPSLLNIEVAENQTGISRNFDIYTNEPTAGKIFVAGVGESGQDITMDGDLLEIMITYNDGGTGTISFSDLLMNEGDPEVVATSAQVSVTDIVCGDVTNDFSVSALDAAFILRHSVRMAPQYPLAGRDSTAADITANGFVSAFDAAMIIKHIVGYPVTLNCRPTNAAKTVVWQPTFAWTPELSKETNQLRVPITISDIRTSISAVEIQLPKSEHLKLASVSNIPEGWEKLIHSTGEYTTIATYGLNDLEDETTIVLNFDVEGSSFNTTLEANIRVNEAPNSSLEPYHVEVKPTQFNLSQNYPNPFNPSTKIEFALPEAAEVRLDVFNMLGQKVQTLKNERMAAGFYSVVFEAGGLSSGVYVYQLRMGNAVLTKRMLLLK